MDQKKTGQRLGLNRIWIWIQNQFPLFKRKEIGRFIH